MTSNQSLHHKLTSGQKAYGAFFYGNCVHAEILAQLGLDFVVIDCEHGPGDVESTLEIIKSCELYGMTPLVRVRQSDRTSILKMLDIGAKGLFVPFLKTPQEVREVVSYAKFAPVGDRGFGLGHAAGYGLSDVVRQPLEDYFRWANEQVLLFPQCETKEFLENIEEIVNISGVDGIFVGEFDLSISMGIPGQFDAPVFLSALDRVVKAVKKAGKYCLCLGESSSVIKRHFDMGFDGAVIRDTVFTIMGYNCFKDSLKTIGL